MVTPDGAALAVEDEIAGTHNCSGEGGDSMRGPQLCHSEGFCFPTATGRAANYRTMVRELYQRAPHNQRARRCVV